MKSCNIKVSKMSTGCSFGLELYAVSGDRHGCVKIDGAHTNVIEVNSNGVDITDKYSEQTIVEESGDAPDLTLLNVQDIVEFADTCDLTELRPYLKRQIELNMAIAEEGIRGSWGANIGKVMLSMGGDISRKARAYAAAGSDARMSGCEMPVCIISGSGNQGITASVPVAIYAMEMGKSEDEMLRALLVSDLITIHQKTGIGTLSAYCGAISAGVGAGAGICYLQGGRFADIAHTLVNSVAILSGTICDGAKPSCAAKIAMAVEAGIMGYEMCKCGSEFHGGDGIVTKGVENTIKNVGRLAKEGMSDTDREIIEIMLGI
jgi:L-cysteine desulfidase